MLAGVLVEAWAGASVWATVLPRGRGETRGEDAGGIVGEAKGEDNGEAKGEIKGGGREGAPGRGRRRGLGCETRGKTEI